MPALQSQNVCCWLTTKVYGVLCTLIAGHCRMKCQEFSQLENVKHRVPEE